MRHLTSSRLCHNLINLQTRVSLPVTGALSIPLARMILKYSNLGALFLRDDRSQHLGLFDGGLANLDCIAISDQQHILQLELLANLGWDSLDENSIAHLSTILSRT
jgi:hypothetical protein